MNYIVRYWQGRCSPWISILVWIVGYALLSALVVRAEPLLPWQIAKALLFVLWLALILYMLIGMVRSAIRALIGWRARRADAVGAVIALVLAAIFIIFTALDVWHG